MRTHHSPALISLLRSGLLVALMFLGREGHAALRHPLGSSCGPHHAQACAVTSRSRAPRSHLPSSVARMELRQRAAELGRQAGIAGLLDRTELAHPPAPPALNAESRAALEEMVAAAAPPAVAIDADLVTQR